MKKLFLSSTYVVGLSLSLSLSSFAAETLFVTNNAVKNALGQVRPNASLTANKELNANLNSPLHTPFIGDKSVLNSRMGMRINPKAFDKDEISITLSDGTVITPKKINRYTTSYSGSIVWRGVTKNAKIGTIEYAANQTVLVLRNGLVTGTVDHDGKHYQIRAAKNGEHTLAQLEIRKVQIPDHDERSYRALPRIVSAPMSSMKQAAVNSRPEIADFDQEKVASRSAASNTQQTVAAAPVVYPPVIRILVNYTPAVAAQSATILADIDKLIDDTNTSFQDSGSRARVTLAYAAPTAYTESAGASGATNFENDKNAYGAAYNGTEGTVMREIKSQRDLYRADVAMLLISRPVVGVCGLAGSIGATAATAFAVVDYGCAINTAQRSFTHEFGHLFGARHDPAEDTEVLPYAYGHGFKTGSSASDIGSIMSRQLNPDPSNPVDFHRRQNLWSNPAIPYTKNGQTLPFGDVATSHNARVLDVAVATMASFSPAPVNFPRDRDYYIIGTNSTDLTVGAFADPTHVNDPEYIPRAGTTSLTFKDMIVNLEIAAKARSIAVADLNSLIELYVAFFNRVPEANGLAYWIDDFKRGQTLNQIAQGFYTAAVLYSDDTGYSATMSHNDFIRIVYKNVLGRDVTATDSGVVYWTEQLSSGLRSRGEIVGIILNSAHAFKNDPTWHWVADLLDNKLAVAKIFSIRKGLNYRLESLNISKGKAIAQAVTPTDINAAVALIGIRDVNFIVP